MPFTFLPMRLPGVIMIVPKRFDDERGFFLEAYKASAFEAQGIREHFVQDNHSHSIQGVLRGLHYQRPPKAQAKLVRTLRGDIFDVVVDIRQGSPTYGQWAGATLSAQDGRMLYVPSGFAHGFCVLSEVAEVAYKVTAEYTPEAEGGLLWNDPDIGIRWPIDTPYLSEKDMRHPLLRHSETIFTYLETGANT